MEKTKERIFPFLLGVTLILALVLRLKTYLLAAPLWHDEYALACSLIVKSFLGLLQPLAFEQKAPAIFMMLNKCVYYCFGIQVLSLKLVPMLSGVFSVALFYFVSNQVLKNKVNIIIANFLFAINYQLIYWAQKFKPYSLDVMVFLVGVLLFANLDLETISYKKCFMFSFLSILFVLTSFPSAFLIGGYVLYCLLSRVDIKKTLTFTMPMAFAGSAYYFKVLYGVQAREVFKYMSYWSGGFLKLNLKSFLLLFRENFNFFFYPNNFVLFGIVLFITGIVLLLRDKNKVAKIFLLSFLVLLSASFLQIYPIWQRTALYFLPVVILIITKPLDVVSINKKALSSIIIVLFAAFFCKYNISYLQNFFSKDIFMKSDSLTTFPKLVENYNSQTDILVLNTTTKADFIYYSRLYRFDPKRYFMLPIYRYDKDYYYSLLDNLPKGQIYWFIYGWENSHRVHDLKNNIAHHLQTYIKENHLKVLQEYNDNGSILMKIQF